MKQVLHNSIDKLHFYSPPCLTKDYKLNFYSLNIPSIHLEKQNMD